MFWGSPLRFSFAILVKKTFNRYLGFRAMEVRVDM